jgi:PPOX class probable F420-dependent enzyme
MIPKSHADILDKRVCAHIATIGPRGEPQCQPVWFEWDGEHFSMTHTKARQKYRNIHRDPRVALSIQDPDDPLRYMEVRGVVDAIVEDPEGELLNRLSHHYQGKDFRPRPGEERVILKIRPTKVNTHGRALG